MDHLDFLALRVTLGTEVCLDCLVRKENLLYEVNVDCLVHRDLRERLVSQVDRGCRDRKASLASLDFLDHQDNQELVGNQDQLDLEVQRVHLELKVMLVCLDCLDCQVRRDNQVLRVWMVFQEHQD